MLVLSRKVGQQIQIGPDLTLTVIQIRGEYVRLGFEAPRELRIVRTELLEKEEPKS